MTNERMLLASGDVRCPVTILRIPGIYGRSPNDHSVIGKMVDSIEREGRVRHRGRETILRDDVYLTALCRLTERLIPLRHHGVLNVATGRSVAFAALAQQIIALCGEPVRIHALSCQTPVTHRHVDTSALVRAFPGFWPTPLADGLAETLANMAEEAAEAPRSTRLRNAASGRDAVAA